MKKLLSVFTVILCLCISVLPALAAKAPSHMALIDIEDGILSNEETDQITELAEAAADEINASVGIILTSSSLSEDQLIRRADRLFDSRCDPSDDAIILAVDTVSRKYYIRQINRLNDLPSREADNIESAVLKWLKQNDWFLASMAFTSAVSEHCSAVSDTSSSSNGASGLLKKEIIGFCIAAVIGLAAAGIMASKMNNAKAGRNAASYIKKDSFVLSEQSDMYLYSTVSKIRVESSSSGGGSRGGRSRGGRGGSF